MKSKTVFPFPRAPLQERLELVRRAEKFLKQLPSPQGPEEALALALLFDLLVREERRILRKLWRLE